MIHLITDTVIAHRCVHIMIHLITDRTIAHRCVHMMIRLSDPSQQHSSSTAAVPNYIGDAHFTAVSSPAFSIIGTDLYILSLAIIIRPTALQI